MYRNLYSEFLKGHEGWQHYAAHSHHFWPDVTREATLQYWQDSARMSDDKWDYFFGEKIPQAQKLIAANIGLSHPDQIVFAPNTHELLYRILSCYSDSPVKVLCTDSEFYSFERQINRLSENKRFQITKIESAPYHNFSERFVSAIKSANWDVIFFSRVFFNSGVVVREIEKIISSVKNENTAVVIDDYHGFMALPIDVSKFEDKAFYLAGSYKYAQGGEGCCFMTVPKGSKLRPEYTGWFAGFESLTQNGGGVAYSDNAMRFAGSTMDFTALYRLSSVLKLFSEIGLTVEKIHRLIQLQQQNFLEEISKLKHPYLRNENILQNGFDQHGHFFAFKLESAELVKKLHSELESKKIKTDFRADRLRFGFGLYQEDRIDLSHVKNL